MYTFVRAVKLSNICGRSDYITNKTGKHSEEDVLCIGGATSDWTPYAQYEQTHQRSSEPNNEGRELIVALPNDWGRVLTKPFLANRADKLARKLIGKNTDYQFAVHWNKAHTNLHLHIIFSERTKTPSQTKSKGSTSDFYDRDVYLTQDGKVARKKADRAVHEDGSVKPPIHRKGDPKLSEFTAKDKKYKSKAWLQAVKKAVKSQFVLSADKKHVPNYLHTYHEGKAPEAAERIRQQNALCRQFNQYIELLRNEGYKFPPVGDKTYNLCAKKLTKDGLTDDFANWLIDNVALNGDIIYQKSLKALERKNQQIEKVYELAEEILNYKLKSAVSNSCYTYEWQETLRRQLPYAVNDKKYKQITKQYYKLLKELDDDTKRCLADYIATKAKNTLTGDLYIDTLFEVGNAMIADIVGNHAHAVELPSQAKKRQERQRLQGSSSLDELKRIAHEKYLEQQAHQYSQEKSRDVDDWSR